MIPGFIEQAWREAIEAEQAGRLLDARDHYQALVATLDALGRAVPPHVLERFAGVLSALHQFEAAEHLLIALRLTLDPDDLYGAFRAKVGLAEVFVARSGARDAVVAFAALEDDAGPWEPLFTAPDGDSLIAPEAAAERADAILERAAAASFPRAGALDLALARAEACAVLARLWMDVGRHEAAAASAARALAIAVHGTPWISRADLALLAAEAYAHAGELRVARELAKAFQGAGDVAARLRWELFAARLDADTGALGRARRRMGEVLAQARALGLADVELRAAWSLAQLLALINRTDDAEQTLVASTVRLTSSGVGDALVRRLDELRALVQRRRTSNVDAIVIPALPGQILRGMPAPSVALPPTPILDVDDEGALPAPFADEIAGRVNRVLIAVHDRDRDDARARLARLLARVDEGEAPALKVRAQVCAGVVALAEARALRAPDLLLESACASLASAADGARALGLVADEWQARRFLAWALSSLGDGAASLAEATRAKLLLDQLAASLDPDDRVFFLLNKWSAQDEYIAARASWATSPPGARGVGALWHRLRQGSRVLALYREIAALTGWEIDCALAPGAHGAAGATPKDAVTRTQIEAWVEQHLALLERTSDIPRPFRPSRLALWRIPRDAAVVHYYALADRLLVFVLRRGGISLRIVPITRIDLERAAYALVSAAGTDPRRKLPDGSDPSLRERRGEARRAGALLAAYLGLDVIAEELRGRVERLILIPHDVIVNVPFAALRVEGDYLCERFVITCLPQLRWLAPEGAAAPIGSEPFLGVAASCFPGWPERRELRFAVSEIEEAQRHLPPATPITSLREQDATRAHVIAAMQASRWIHVVSHGELAADAPHRSAILLPGQVGVKESIAITDVMQMDLQRVRAVVLACCSLSGATVLPGGVTVCLPAAFLRRGARSVIASLWEIDDAVGCAFAGDVYCAARAAGLARALAEAQRAWITQRGFADPCELKQHPFFWAAWSHFGSG